MDKREAAKLDMYRAVRDLRTGTLGTAATAAIAAIPALDEAFDDHASDITILEALDLSRAEGAAGGGPAKDTARKQAILAFSELDGALTSYAATAGDADLLDRVNHEDSDLVRMSDEALRLHATYLLAKAAEPAITTALEHQGITAAKLTLYNQRYDTFHALINLPDDRAQQESLYVGLIDSKFAAMDLRLDLVMDKLMRQIRTTDEPVFLAYKQARVINDNAGGSTAASTGTGSGGGTGTPGGSSSSASGSSSSSTSSTSSSSGGSSPSGSSGSST